MILPRGLFDSSVCTDLMSSATGGSSTTTLRADLSESFIVRQRVSGDLLTYVPSFFSGLLSQWQTLTSLTLLDLNFSGQYLPVFPQWF